MTEKCTRCAGCGKIADSDDGEPWSYWMRLPVESATAIALGIVKPVSCPQCGGTGWMTPEQVEIAQLRKALALAREQVVWIEGFADVHCDQEPHVLCHNLTVDIPDAARIAREVIDAALPQPEPHGAEEMTR